MMVKKQINVCVAAETLKKNQLKTSQLNTIAGWLFNQLDSILYSLIIKLYGPAIDGSGWFFVCARAMLNESKSLSRNPLKFRFFGVLKNVNFAAGLHLNLDIC